MHTHTHTWCYVIISSFALAHGRDATLSYDLLHLHNLAHALDATLLYLLWDRTYQWIFTHNLAKWHLTDNMKKGWNTCRLNFSSSHDPNTSFMKLQNMRRFLYIEVKNAGVWGAVLPCLYGESSWFSNDAHWSFPFSGESTSDFIRPVAAVAWSLDAQSACDPMAGAHRNAYLASRWPGQGRTGLTNMVDKVGEKAHPRPKALNVYNNMCLLYICICMYTCML